MSGRNQMVWLKNRRPGIVTDDLLGSDEWPLFPEDAPFMRERTTLSHREARILSINRPSFFLKK